MKKGREAADNYELDISVAERLDESAEWGATKLTTYAFEFKS